MSHPFGNLLSQHLHRRHGLSQARLAEGIGQDPSIVGKMCKGERLAGRHARARIVAIIGWLHAQGVLETEVEANALLAAAVIPPLCDNDPAEHVLLRALRDEKVIRLSRISPSVPLVNLPAAMTSFIGRAQELAHIARMLADHRLVTITGVGGIGKTRTAIEVARQFVGLDNSPGAEFPDGIWFVPLEAVDMSERMASAIADAVQCPPPGAADVGEHLLTYLQPRRMLLVLDNFEHLRDGSDFLTAIMLAAPRVYLLVTSREALNLEQEWRVPLNGLSLAAGTDTESIQSSAARLFGERARRVSPGFDRLAAGATVERICQLVEGNPLAIELAATWTRVLSCEAIAQQIVGDLAFLTSNMRNVPMRHRSMRAVFDHSWMLLSEEERRVFARLSVFQGGFTRSAAEDVANTGLSTLSALVDKSLLRLENENRFRIHEFLRQCAAERLAQAPQDADHARASHCTVYANYLEQRSLDMNGRRQREAQREIATENENIRAAWQYALQHRRVGELQRAAYTFYLFHDFLNRYQEGAEQFEQAVQQMDAWIGNHPPTVEIGPLLSEILVCLGWLLIRLGELQRAREALERSQAVLTHLAFAPRPGPGTDPMVALGTLANAVGDYEEAHRLGEEARQRSEAHNDPGNLMYAYYVLTNAALARGRFEEAMNYGLSACDLATKLQDRWFMAYLLADLGHIARACGDYPEAIHRYQECFLIRSEFDDPEGIAFALVHLGQVSLLQSDVENARRQFEQSLRVYREIGDRGGESTALHGLGMADRVDGGYSEAARHLLAALEIAITIGFSIRANAILGSVAELFLHLEMPHRAVALLVPILRDPTSDRETCDVARVLLARCAQQLAPESYATTTHGRQAIDYADVFLMLARIGAGVLTPLNGEPEASLPLALPSRFSFPARPADKQPKPLTARELAVLQLIACGNSNEQIAEHLVITPGTAKWYVSQIFSKLEVHSRTQAVARAQGMGYLT